MFENHKKSLIQQWKTEVWGQTVLPESSILKGQKLLENAKIVKFKWDILSDFKTLCALCAWS